MKEPRDVLLEATVSLSRAQLCEAVRQILGDLPDQMELVMRLDRANEELQGWRNEYVRLEEEFARHRRRAAQLVCRLAKRVDATLPPVEESC